MRGTHMIFVALGTQKFQFNRLLKKIDDLVENKIITEEVFAQIGHSDYHPQNYPFKPFLNHKEFDDAEQNSDIIITHGGSGAIIGAIKKSKKVIAVPRLAKYGEHVDDHQIQLIKQFADMGIIEACFELDDLGQAYTTVRSKKYMKYCSKTNEIIQSINDYLVQNFNARPRN